MSHKIKATWAELLHQSDYTATDYLNSALRYVAQAKIPKELQATVITEFVRAASYDLRTSSIIVIGQGIQESLLKISEALNSNDESKKSL